MAVILFCGYCGAQTKSQSEPQAVNQTASTGDLTPGQIIERFAQKETEFFEAWMQYAYTQRATIRVLSVDGVKQNETLSIVSEVVFKDDGTREIRDVRRSGWLRSVLYTKQDQDIIDNINPFALTMKDLNLYDLNYEGKEKVDELDCYVFSVKPKKTRGDQLYFQGKIWVDDLDLQIVRTIGNVVPQKDAKFPGFETIRQRIDKKYWFPAWTHAEGFLKFSSDEVVQLEETITYENYKKFTSKAVILDGTVKPSEPK